MRRVTYFWLILALACAGRAIAVAEAPAKEELSVPSEEVVKTFVTTAKEKPESKDTLQFNVSFKPAVLPAAALEIYRAKGKIPFAISVELLKNIPTEDGTEKHIFEGAANIVVVDKEGQVVSKKREDLSALCPS
jgi:hypothetical protein